VLETRGNAHGHVILRGGRKPNYDSVNVALAEQALEKAGLPSVLEELATAVAERRAKA